MDAYPLPYIEDSLNTLGGAPFFCSLDLDRGVKVVTRSHYTSRDGPQKSWPPSRKPTQTEDPSQDGSGPGTTDRCGKTSRESHEKQRSCGTSGSGCSWCTVSCTVDSMNWRDEDGGTNWWLWRDDARPSYSGCTEGQSGSPGHGSHSCLSGTRILLAGDTCRRKPGLSTVRLRAFEDEAGKPGAATSVHCGSSHGMAGHGHGGAVPHHLLR